jgi:hypothetical protein
MTRRRECRDDKEEKVEMIAGKGRDDKEVNVGMIGSEGRNDKEGRLK